jgi:hypothetical protein
MTIDRDKEQQKFEQKFERLVRKMQRLPVATQHKILPVIEGLLTLTLSNLAFPMTDEQVDAYLATHYPDPGCARKIREMWEEMQRRHPPH